MKENKGNVSGLMISIGGLLTTTLFGLNYFSLNGVAKTNEVVSKQGERITVVEVRTERLPIIEAKLDKLLEKQNISPAMVERNIFLASTTSDKVRFQ